MFTLSDFRHRKEEDSKRETGLTFEEEKIFRKIKNAYDVLFNTTTLETDDIIVKIFAYNILHIQNKTRIISLGYSKIYVDIHKNSPYVEKRELTLTYNEWASRIMKFIQESEDE